MNNDYLTLTQLGRIYGVSRNVVGKWLKALSLRTQSGDPSQTAHDDGFVKKVDSTNPGTFFYVWHKQKTTELLDGMGYERADLDTEIGDLLAGGS